MPTFEVTVQENRTQARLITKLVSANGDTEAINIVLDAVEDGSLEDDSGWDEWETLDQTENPEVLDCKIVDTDDESIHPTQADPKRGKPLEFYLVRAVTTHRDTEEMLMVWASNEHEAAQEFVRYYGVTDATAIKVITQNGKRFVVVSALPTNPQTETLILDWVLDWGIVNAYSVGVDADTLMYPAKAA